MKLLNKLSLFIIAATNLNAQLIQQADQTLINMPEYLQNAAIQIHTPFGIPLSTQYPILILINREYIIGYSPDLKVPVWTSYTLIDHQLPKTERTNAFRPDPRLPKNQSAQLQDYIEPVYDRGHMTPSYDIAHSEIANANTFILSNIIPQHNRFNREIWAYLEKHIRETLLPQNHSLNILTIAIFDHNKNKEPDDINTIPRIKKNNTPAIPTHFAKIVTDPHGTVIGCWLLPHNDNKVSEKNSPNYLNRHTSFINHIEKISGLTILK